MIPKKHFSTLKVSWGVIDTRVFVPPGFSDLWVRREIYNSSRAADSRSSHWKTCFISSKKGQPISFTKNISGKFQKMGFSVKFWCLFLSYEVTKEFWRKKMWNCKSWDFPSNRNILFRFYEVRKEFWQEKLSNSKSWDFSSNHNVCIDYTKSPKNFDEEIFGAIRDVVTGNTLGRKPLFWKGKNAYSKMSEDSISLTLSPMV